MKSFGTLLKIELKLNIRNMNMVIFAVIFQRTKLHLHLCGWANGSAPCRIRISGTKNLEALSSHPYQPSKITFGSIFDLYYLLHRFNTHPVPCRHAVLGNKNTWGFAVILGKLAFDYGIDFEYRIVSWWNCQKYEKRKRNCLYLIFPHADFFGYNASLRGYAHYHAKNYQYLSIDTGYSANEKRISWVAD